MITPILDALMDAFIAAGYDGVSALEYANQTIREFQQSGKQSETFSIGKQTFTLGRN